jgi:hypothetical protein
MYILNFIFLLFLHSFPASTDILQLDKAAMAKMDKAVKSTFRIENFNLQPLNFAADNILTFAGHDNSGSVFRIFHDDSLQGFLYSGSAKGRNDWFDFIIIYNPALIIERVEILVYRSDRGVEIMNKKWLAQFIGTNGCDLQYGKDIDAVSGATLSANSLTSSIASVCNDLQLIRDMISKNNTE